MTRQMYGSDRAGRTTMRALVGWLAGAAMLLGIGWAAGLRINLTRSLPVGLYRIAHGAPIPGTMVLACLTSHVAVYARERGYVPHGGICPGGTVPIGKVVLGVAGDTVRLSAAGMWLNSVPVPRSRPRARDSRGRPLRRWPDTTWVLIPGQLWLYSPYSAWSFDSRYFGPIAMSQVITQVRPLWTIGQP